ncbi:MAG: hypothetical protein D3904_00715 [Candidatus Electrothrix sp. EH2]|nr:hypothetical protein [Candidatus Electrothrix sp. EH2]
MSEDVINEYKIIFEIRLLYHYWVKYLEDFHLLSASELKERISSYDSRSFFTIQPSKKTEKKLEQLGWIYKKTSLGCIVAALTDHFPSYTDELELRFLLNPLSGDIAEYSGKISSRDEDGELKRYKKILWFSGGRPRECW